MGARETNAYVRFLETLLAAIVSHLEPLWRCKMIFALAELLLTDPLNFTNAPGAAITCEVLKLTDGVDAACAGVMRPNETTVVTMATKAIRACDFTDIIS